MKIISARANALSAFGAVLLAVAQSASGTSSCQDQRRRKAPFYLN